MSDFVDIFSFYEFEDSKGNKHQFPYSYERYGHFPFLPSEADKYIKYLEDYRDHCKDEEILAYNEKGLENSNNYYQDFKYSSESKKKTDEEIVNDYFNFDDFDNEEYNCALQNLKEYARNEVYDVNILLKEGLNDVSLAKDEVFAIVFFKDGAVSKVAYSSDILSYIGSHKQYGNEVLNEKVRTWKWDDARYEEAHTSDKALSTAMELIRTCFPTGEIVPKDPNTWDAGSHTDGEQIVWDGGYGALVDAYIRMDKDPCYYVQVAVPLEAEAKPCISIFGCYPLGWDYCCNQIHDPAVLREELADREAIRNGTRNTDDGAGAPVPMPTAG